MSKRTLWRMSAGFMTTLTVLAAIFAGLYSSPFLYGWLGDHLSFVKLTFQGLDEWAYNLFGRPYMVNDYPQLWGAVFLAIVFGTLLLLTIVSYLLLFFAVKKPKTVTATKPLTAEKNSYVVPFVDADGNFGHTLIKGKSGTSVQRGEGVNKERLDEEFDWHNYVGGRPIGRIITGAIIALLAATVLVFRFGWFLQRHDPGVWNGLFQNEVMQVFFKGMDYVQNALFGHFSSVTFFDQMFTAADMLDLVFWLMIAFALDGLVLACCSLIVCFFRRPAAQRRAAVHRQKYLDDLYRGNFRPVYANAANFVLISPKYRAPRPVLPLEETVESETPVTGAWPLNYEGNIIRRSVSSYATSSFDDDILLINPISLSYIGVIEQGKIISPAPALTKSAKEKARAVFPRSNPMEQPSDKEGVYWYAHAKALLLAKAHRGDETASRPELSPEVVYDRFAKALEPDNLVPVPNALRLIRRFDIEITATAFDEEGEVTAAQGEIKVRPATVPLQPLQTIKPRSPIKPVAPLKQVPATPVETAAASNLGPVNLQHKIVGTLPVRVKPVAAAMVPFQLKTIAGNYKGSLTAAEAFLKAVTNQSVVVAPVYGDDKGRARLSKERQKRRERTLVEGYMSSAAIARLGQTAIDSQVFDQPISAYASIREWNKARYAWEQQQKTSVRAPSKTVRPPLQPVAPLKVNGGKRGDRSVAPLPHTIKPVVPIKPIQPLKPLTPRPAKSKPTDDRRGGNGKKGR